MSIHQFHSAHQMLCTTNTLRPSEIGRCGHRNDVHGCACIHPAKEFHLKSSIDPCCTDGKVFSAPTNLAELLEVEFPFAARLQTLSIHALPSRLGSLQAGRGLLPGDRPGHVGHQLGRKAAFCHALLLLLPPHRLQSGHPRSHITPSTIALVRCASLIGVCWKRHGFELAVFGSHLRGTTVRDSLS